MKCIRSLATTLSSSGSIKLDDMRSPLDISAVPAVSRQYSRWPPQTILASPSPSLPARPAAGSLACEFAIEPQSGRSSTLKSWKVNSWPRKTAERTPVCCSTLQIPGIKNEHKKHVKNQTSTKMHACLSISNSPNFLTCPFIVSMMSCNLGSIRISASLVVIHPCVPL